MLLITSSGSFTIDSETLKVLFDGVEIPKTTRENKGKSLVGFPDTYCVVDTETTGLSPDYDDIIEIGAIKYSNGVEVGTFQSLIQPPQDKEDSTFVSAFITDLTGITNEMLADAPTADIVLPMFSDFVGEDIIVGYNTNFDINFLYDAFWRLNLRPLSNDYIDIMRFARKLFPEMPHHRLIDMIQRFDIKAKVSHRALADVESTAQCYIMLRNEALQQYETVEAFVDTFKHKSKYKYGQGIRAGDIVGDESKQDSDNPLYGKYCVFTGKLEKFTRQKAMQLVADLGGINEDSVTKNTNFLILGNNDYCSTIKDGKSTKQKKAESYKLKGRDIEIIPETVFYDMLGDSI